MTPDQHASVRYLAGGVPAAIDFYTTHPGFTPNTSAAPAFAGGVAISLMFGQDVRQWPVVDHHHFGRRAQHVGQVDVVEPGVLQVGAGQNGPLHRRPRRQPVPTGPPAGQP